MINLRKERALPLVNCLVCEMETESLYHSKFDMLYFQCKKCGFIFKDRHKILPSSDEFACYEGHENSIEDPRYVAFFLKFLTKAVFPFFNGGEALDFGSGPEPVLAQILRKYFRIKVDIYDKYYAPYPVFEEKEYDMILCTEVAEHLDDPQHYFALFSKHLKKEGMLSIMTLIKQQEQDFLSWHYMRETTHISFYTKESLEYLAEKNGLAIVYTDNRRYITLKKL